MLPCVFVDGEYRLYIGLGIQQLLDKRLILFIAEERHHFGLLVGLERLAPRAPSVHYMPEFMRSEEGFCFVSD